MFPRISLISPVLYTLKPALLTSFLIIGLGLSGCEKQADKDSISVDESDDKSITLKDVAELQVSDDVESHNTSDAPSDISLDTPLKNDDSNSKQDDKKIQIDWDKIKTNTQPINADDFEYPFELNSDSVKSQAKFSNITLEQARHSLTVGMASNEPLSALLDQLGNSYLSHDYSIKEAKLYVYTTKNVEPSSFDYVINHEFAKGLTLPIEVVPKSEP